MVERYIYRRMREFERLRGRQHGRGCRDNSARQGDNGADRAEIIRLVRVMAGRGQLLRGELEGRRRCDRCDSVEMSERQHKLDRQGKQRNLRTSSDI